MYADPQQKAQFLWLAEFLLAEVFMATILLMLTVLENCAGMKKFDKAWKIIIYSFFINNYSECWLVWVFDVGIDLPSYSSRWLR